MTLDTRRHDLLFDKTTCTYPVHIIGVGGVGSNVARLLAKLAVGERGPVHAWDHDIVEAHNVPNQAYDAADVGMPKTEALKRHYRQWNGGEIVVHTERVQGPIPLSGVVFLCVDNNDVRKEICESSVWKKQDISLLIETRMDATHVIVHTVDPSNDRHIECWNLFWYPHAETENLAGCGGPASVITASDMTANVAVQQFVHWHARRFSGLANQIQLDLVTWESAVGFW